MSGHGTVSHTGSRGNGTQVAKDSTQVSLGTVDDDLLRRLRGGEDSAFKELFEQHSAAVRRLALGMARDRAEAEDITAETFYRVLQALRRGAGPRDHVRAYLLTVARRVCWEWHGARRDVPVDIDELTYRAGAGADNLGRTAEHSLITRAFSSLPERWRTVLWQTEVEGEQPAVVAPHYGLSANATAALARRARLGLRAAYLQAHLATDLSVNVSCRAVMQKLGGYTAGSVTGTEARKIRLHLLGCSACNSMHSELRDVCSSLRAHAGILVLLLPASAVGIAGAASAGATGASAGLLATMKGFFFGSQAKVGLALASTAAVGALGAGIGPVVIDPDNTQSMELHGQGGQLVIVSPTPSTPSPTPSPTPSVSIPSPTTTTEPPVREPRSEKPTRHEQKPAPSSSSTVLNPIPKPTIDWRLDHDPPHSTTPSVKPSPTRHPSKPPNSKPPTSKPTKPTTKPSSPTSTVPPLPMPSGTPVAPTELPATSSPGKSDTSGKKSLTPRIDVPDSVSSEPVDDSLPPRADKGNNARKQHRHRHHRHDCNDKKSAVQSRLAALNKLLPRP